MVLKIAFSVDDIAPIEGFGLEKEKGNLNYLLKLNEEFGVKFTLFLIPNLKGQNNIEYYSNWINWLKSKPFFEIAAHGYEHWNSRGDSIEFFKIPKEKAEELIKKCLECFHKVGIEPHGFKYPGWLYETEFINLLFPNFKYLADHFVSIYSIKMTNGFYRIPYTLSAENLHSNHYDDTLIIHSHIGVDKQNKNGFTDELYENVRNYLKEIIKKNNGNVRFVTFSELIKNET